MLCYYVQFVTVFGAACASSHMQHGRVPLHYAANSGRVGAVKALVSEFHCPVDHRDAVSIHIVHTVHVRTYCTYTIHTYIRRHGSDIYLGRSLIQNGSSYLVYKRSSAKLVKR